MVSTLVGENFPLSEGEQKKMKTHVLSLFKKLSRCHIKPSDRGKLLNHRDGGDENEFVRQSITRS